MDFSLVCDAAFENEFGKPTSMENIARAYRKSIVQPPCGRALERFRVPRSGNHSLAVTFSGNRLPIPLPYIPPILAISDLSCVS